MRLLFTFFLLVASADSFAMGAKPGEPAPSPAPVPAPTPKPTPAPEPTPSPAPAPKPVVNGGAVRARYGKIKDASAKLVDNKGNGFEALYGTRNVRGVLNGIYYRGGANNYYHRSAKRENENPLPNDGLSNLCEEGFTEAVYLYDTRFSTAPQITRCRLADGSENVLSYRQITGLKTTNNRALLGIVLDHVRNERAGPVYMHCWNGWHASGYVAAITLRQFCGFSGDEAAAYWTKNIDGVEVGESVRNSIRAFKPFSDLNLTAAERAVLCPSTAGLKFP